MQRPGLHRREAWPEDTRHSRKEVKHALLGKNAETNQRQYNACTPITTDIYDLPPKFTFFLQIDPFKITVFSFTPPCGAGKKSYFSPIMRQNFVDILTCVFMQYIDCTVTL
jgi:hypothetical protein